MGSALSATDGYSWSGDLAETDIRSVYAACHSLRFSGRLELADGAHRAEVVFLGGEPVEIAGGDTERIALWTRGTFRAVQTIPDLRGELTTARDLSGSLASVRPSTLWSWVSEYRLTCAIEIERPGERAVVQFSNGHAESAEVNGRPELAALARVSSWTDGAFRVRLRPLFVDGKAALGGAIPPPITERDPVGPRQFDVSRSIPVDLRHKAAAPATPVPPPLISEPIPTGRAAASGASSAGTSSGTSSGTPAAESNAPKRDISEVTGSVRPLPDPRRGRGGRVLTIVLVASLALGGGVFALYHYRLPPFSPPPRPIVDAPVEPIPPTPPTTTATPPTPPTTPPPTPPTTPKSPSEPSAATKEPTPPPAKEPQAKEPEPKRPPSKVDPKTREKADKLVAKARTLLVEGHEHSALDLLRKAKKLNPADAAIDTFEQQALGKLGRAEVIIDGKLPVTIDGHKFAPPRKLKLPAGPHDVDLGDGASELVLKRGEKRKLRAKR